MTNEIQGFVIPIEARIDRLEKSLKKASQAQSRFARDVNNRSKRNADAMVRHYESAGQRISNSFKSIALPKIIGLAGAVTGFGMAGATSAIRSTVRDISTIGDEAKRAGVAVEAFQEWSYVAAQNRIGIDALTDSFKELNLRADEFVITGKGSASEAFARLGISAQDLQEKLKDPSALMLEIIGRLEHMDKAAQIRISDEIFGGSGGERMVELLSQGTAGIQSQIDRARDLGFVMDAELIAKAEELDRKFSQLTATAANFGKRLAVEIADFVSGLVAANEQVTALEQSGLFKNRGQAGAVLGGDVVAALERTPAAIGAHREAITLLSSDYNDFRGQLQAMGPQLQGFGNHLFRIGQTGAADAFGDLAEKIRELNSRWEAGTLSAGEFEDQLADLIGEASDALKAIRSLDEPRFDSVLGRLGALGEALDGLREKAAAARAAMPGGRTAELAAYGIDPAAGMEGMAPTSRAPVTSIKPPPAPAMVHERLPADRKPGGAGARSESEYARSIESLRQETAALEAEAVALIAVAASGREYADAVEFARTRAELLNAANQDGRQITPELTAEVDRLAEAHVNAGNAAKKAADGLKGIEERGKRGAEALSDVFVSVLDGSKSAEQAIADLLIQIAKIQFQKHFVNMFGGTGAANMLGGLLGFSQGGFTGHGGTFEPAGVVHRGEFVLSKRATQRIGVGNLEALHRGALRGYSGGGLVDGIPKVAESLKGSSEKSTAPSITISAPITVNGSGGTPEQNNDLAKQMARESEQMFRGLVRDELTRNMRPGGMLR